MIDLSHVPARHDAINLRLEHWASWVKARPQAWKSQPMFRQYRSHAWQWHVPEIKIEINTLEAHETERAVSMLPDKHRAAVRWAYVFAYIPVNAIRRDLGATRQELCQLINDGRDMLIARLHQIMVDNP
jgi:hypothetical protein